MFLQNKSKSFSDIKRLVSGPMLVLIIILIVLLLFKVIINSKISEYNVDGGYYYDVAKHVMSGSGLKTRISLYHKGYSYFPHETAIYPLWPLLLGYTGRWLPLNVIAIWLPTLLYFISLILAYKWANTIWKDTSIDWLPNLNPGHFTVIILGLNTSYFYFTSIPYTEALAFTMLFCFLLRFDKIVKAPNIIGGIEIGFWMGLLLLVRVQWLMIVLSVVVVYLYLVVFSNKRKIFFSMACISALCLFLVMSPHWYYVSNISNQSGWFRFFYFSLRSNDLLSILNYSFNMSLPQIVYDRLTGFLIAFDFSNSLSYYTIFSAFIYIVPISVIFVLNDLRPFMLNFREMMIHEKLKSLDASVLLVFTISIASFFIVHTLHANYMRQWYFHRRHAIPVFFLVIFLTMYCIKRKRKTTNLIVTVLLFLTIVNGIISLSNVWYIAVNSKVIEEERKQIVMWIEDRSTGRNEINVAASDNEGQRFVWRSDIINYHWVYAGKTSKSDIFVLFDKLSCKYLIERSSNTNNIHLLSDKFVEIPLEMKYFKVYEFVQ